MQQRFDPEIVEMRNSNRSSLALKEISLPESGVHILCNDSMRKLRPVIPASMRFHVFCYFCYFGSSWDQRKRPVTHRCSRMEWNKKRRSYLGETMFAVLSFQRSASYFGTFLRDFFPSNITFCLRLRRLNQSFASEQRIHILTGGCVQILTLLSGHTHERITAEECASSFVSGWVSLFGSPSIPRLLQLPLPVY